MSEDAELPRPPAPDEVVTKSPLHDRHAALGAKFGAFGGWSMPLEYAGGGVLAEHAAVREAVGVFDVSHLGTVLVLGEGAAALIDASFTNSLERIGPGKAQYTLCCDEASGGVIDDLIVYLRSDDDVLLIPNAANAGKVAAKLREHAPSGVDVVDVHRDFAILAVQGPNSAALVYRLGLRGFSGELAYMSFEDVELPAPGETAETVPLTICRTGYTGEHGYELVVPSEHAVAVWDAVFAAGAGLGVRACGLGARDTLRTEMGYPLHGQDLSLLITPNQARLGWAVGWRKPAFWGRDVLLAERERGPARLLRGLVALDRGIPRPHMVVTSITGDPVGEVTSGTFSPTRRIGIALALLPPAIVDGDEVEVDVRGRPSLMTVTKPPFVSSSPTAPVPPETPEMQSTDPGYRIVLVGMMGAGKTTLGNAISAATGWPYIDNDEVVAQLAGMPTRELLQTQGVPAMRAAEAQALHLVLRMDTPLVAGAAAGVVLDEKLSARLHAGAFVVYLHADVDTLARRVAGTARPWLGDDPKEAIRTLYEGREPLYRKIAHLVVDVEGADPAVLASQILAAVRVDPRQSPAG
jgi:aminomethyltransferase